MEAQCESAMKNTRSDRSVFLTTGSTKDLTQTRFLAVYTFSGPSDKGWVGGGVPGQQGKSHHPEREEEFCR